MIATQRVIPIRGLMHELMIPQVLPTPMFTDAKSVLFSSGGGASIRRCPWLLQRIEAVLGAVEDGIIKMLKISGLANPVNSLTKYTPFTEWYRDIAFLSNLDSAPTGATGCVMAIAVASPHGSQFLIAVRSLLAEVVASGSPGPAASCGSSA